MVPAIAEAHGPTDKPHSRFHRSITRPFFSKVKISDFEIFDHHADLVISKLKERFARGIAIDIQDLLSRTLQRNFYLAKM